MTRAAKDKLIATHAPKVAKAVATLIPADLLDNYDPEDDAEDYVDGALGDDYGDIDDEIGSFMKAGHGTAWAAGWITPDEEDPSDSSPRLSKLLDTIPGVRDALIGTVVGLAATAILSHDPETNLADVKDGGGWADVFVQVEVTASFTAGTQDVTEKQGLYWVQLSAAAGECDFCQEYDGRIMPVDHDEGMPPLHRGCQCDVEPLD